MVCDMKEGSDGSTSLPSGQQNVHHPQRQPPPAQAHQCSLATPPTAVHLQLPPTGLIGPQTDGPAKRGGCSRAGKKRRQPCEITCAAEVTNLATALTRSHQQPVPSGPAGSQVAVLAPSHTTDCPQLPLPVSANLTKSQTGGTFAGGDKSISGGKANHQVPIIPMADREILKRLLESRGHETPGSREERHQSITASNSQVQSTGSLKAQTAISSTNCEKPTLTGRKQKHLAAEPSANKSEAIREHLMDGTRGNSSVSGRDKQYKSAPAGHSPVQPTGSAQVQTSHPAGSRNSSTSSGESSTSSDDSSTSSAESLVPIMIGSTQYSDYVAVDVNGIQFKPPSHQDRILRPRSHPPRWVRNPSSNIGIGIETEFLLRARCVEHKAESKVKFAEILEDSHNTCVDLVHPPLREEVVFPDPCPKYQGDEWTLVNDDTVVTDSEPCKPIPSWNVRRCICVCHPFC